MVDFITGGPQGVIGGFPSQGVVSNAERWWFRVDNISKLLNKQSCSWWLHTKPFLSLYPSGSNMKSKAVLPTDQYRICCTIWKKLSKDNLFVCDGFNETKKMSSQWLLYHKWNIENSVFVTSHFGRFENDTSLCVYFVLKIRFLTQFMLHACNYRHAISELQTHETSFGDLAIYDDVIKWKHFPRYWPFVRGIHRSPVNSPHKVQYRGALMFSLICARINGWVNNRCWWFETPSRPLWRHCNDVVQYLQ